MKWLPPPSVPTWRSARSRVAPQHQIVLSAVVPPIAQGDAVLTCLEASLLLIATRGLSDGDTLVDAGERLAYALRRDPRDIDGRPRRDHPAADVDSDRVRNDRTVGREHA